MFIPFGGGTPIRHKAFSDMSDVVDLSAKDRSIHVFIQLVLEKASS